MTTLRRPLRICYFLFGFILIFVSSQSFAACKSPHIRFCQNCEINTTAAVGSDSECLLYYSVTAGIQGITILHKPQHGVVGIDQTTRPTSGATSKLTHVAYKPNSGYSGEDKFSVVVDYLGCNYTTSCDPYKTTINYLVTVAEYNDSSNATSYLASAGGGLEITYSWDALTTHISPDGRNSDRHRAMAFRINNNKEITFVDIVDGKQGSIRKSVIGQDGPAFGASETRMVTNIVGGNIVITEDHQSHLAITTIRSDGRNACSASREYRLKAGFSVFNTIGADHLIHTADNIRAENVRCWISQQN